jgi:hypothetical protein
MNFDPMLLSRIQFAFTVSLHIIFPASRSGWRGGSRQWKVCG